MMRQKTSTGNESVTRSKSPAGIGSTNAKRIADTNKIATTEAIAPRDSQSSWEFFCISFEGTYLILFSPPRLQQKWRHLMSAGGNVLKKNFRFTTFCTLKLNRLRSNESEAVWDRLRDNYNDAALNHADRNLYYAHLRAVMTCLIRIAIARNCGVDLSIAAENFIGDYWKRRAKNIGALAEDYSKAFGSSHSDGVMSIVQLFSAKVTESKMSQQSQQRLYSEFHEFLGIMFEEFKDVALVA